MKSLHQPLIMFVIVVGIMLGIGSGSAWGQDWNFDPNIDSAMYQHPKLTYSDPYPFFLDEARILWIKSLDRPEMEFRYKAATSIAQAQLQGMKKLETCIDPLLKTLDRPEPHPGVQLAIAKALITLDAKKSASSLFRLVKTENLQLCEMIEPALAKWDYAPARELWLDRLKESRPGQRELILAIRSLGEVKEIKAVARLREVLLDGTTNGAVRVAAAHALCSLNPDQILQDAEVLAGDKSFRGVFSRLAAVALLQKKKDEKAIATLKKLVRDPESAVAAQAISRLVDLDPKLVVGDVNYLIAHADAKLRGLGVKILFLLPSEQHVQLLADLMDDISPSVRLSARKALQELGKRKEFQQKVLQEGTRILAKESWRGLEQSTILLTILDHKPSAARMVQLLPHARPDVFITAAWGLRKLSVPETLPSALSYVKEQFSILKQLKKSPGRDDVPYDLMDHQISQLNQLFGFNKYAAADGVLKNCIPRPDTKSLVGSESRAAAIWALGLIHEGKEMPTLAGEVEARLNDVNTMPPEDFRVRRMSAITLARIKAKSTVPSMRVFCPQFRPDTDQVNNACGWAIEQLTGEKMNPPMAVPVVQRDWFLSPNMNP